MSCDLPVLSQSKSDLAKVDLTTLTEYLACLNYFKCRIFFFINRLKTEAESQICRWPFYFIFLKDYRVNAVSNYFIKYVLFSIITCDIMSSQF